jgi:DNA-binding NarL/FixJ family response regulator
MITQATWRSSMPWPIWRAMRWPPVTSRPLGLGQALEDLAVVRAADGDVAAARTALAEAVDIYAGLGAEWDMLRADARLRPYGVRRRRAGTRRPATGWAALTPTETKVAHLVGDGLSNPDIAKRLFLSRRTVQVHVSSILGKLQLRSRVEVAGQIGRHLPPDQEAPPRSTA